MSVTPNAPHYSKLQYLSLNNHYTLTDASFANLLAWCPALLTIELYNCGSLTVQVLDVVHHHSQVQVVKFWT